MKENKVVYLVEGETEKKFIKSKLRNARNKNGVIYNGSVHLFNPYQHKSINKVRRHLARNKTTILVIDTDLRPNNKYYENLENLIRESKMVKILKQKIILKMKCLILLDIIQEFCLKASKLVQNRNLLVIT